MNYRKHKGDKEKEEKKVGTTLLTGPSEDEEYEKSKNKKNTGYAAQY